MGRGKDGLRNAFAIITVPMFFDFVVVRWEITKWPMARWPLTFHSLQLRADGQTLP
jgi:hypothetical protein